MKKKKVIIFANGSVEKTDRFFPVVKDADHIICADGGAVHSDAMNLLPNILIGDMDSVPQQILERFRQHGVITKKFPTAKDCTDLELALAHAIAYLGENGSGTIHIIGGLGGRWDMSLATVLLLARADIEQQKIFIHGDREVICALYPGKHTVYGEPGQRISFLPLGGDIEDVTLTGFCYPASKKDLKAGTSLAVSNSFIEKEGKIEFSCGIMLMILEKTI
ncbi:MAG: thiamine diphosphokinase [Desulfobacterales bacterium]|nr:MAG: thiamine diphosphokinase [Desulfobacterales bacterium]